ncbi:MAG: aldehyde dehydrogenase, partial [Methylocella sp.]
MVDKILADISNQIAIRPHYDNFIGGTWVPAVKGRKFENISPIDGHVVCTIARSTAEDVELALDAAHAAREAWGRTSPAERAQTLLRIADRIEQKLDLLALVETIDNGKPIRETKAADLPLAIDHFRYFAGCLRAQEGSISEIDHDTVAYHFHEPLGVVAQIIPWNFPILMAVWKLAPALAAGNCVVLKPAEQTPMSIMVLVDMIGDLLPPGVLNVINGFGVEAGKPLAQSKRIAKVAFTGETTTGRLIMQYASENIIPVTLELGGKSPNIFFADVAEEDDDFFDKALEGFAMFALNQGEVCTCPSRALVQEKIYDRFMERAILRVKAMKQGNPLDPSTQVGAQASNDQLEKILSYLDIGRQEGAKVLTGGGRADVGSELSGGFYVQPTVLEGHNKMRIFQEEIFGPVLSVTKFKDDEEALAIANDTLYGLGAGIWTRNGTRAYRFGRAIQAGRVWT